MKNIVPEENCLTEVQLLRYLHDECSRQEVQAIDRHLTLCPLCSDALEGAMLLDKGRLERTMKHLDAKISTHYSDKTTFLAVEKPVMTVVKKPKRRLWLWAAASIALIATAGIYLLTKPIEPFGTTSTMANTEGVTVPQQTSPEASVSSQNKDIQANSSKNEGETVNNDGIKGDKTPSHGDADAPLSQETPIVATTQNAPKVENEAVKSSKTPENTEGVALVQKEAKDGKATADDAKKQEVVDADSYKKASSVKEKQTRQVQVPSSNVKNYPGAAAQNNVRREDAAAKFNQPNVDDGLADYQIAMQYYTQADYNQAIAQLNRVLGKQSRGVLYENALWYLANSYLKLGKKQDGQALLQRIVNEKGKFAPQAAALLK